MIGPTGNIIRRHFWTSSIKRGQCPTTSGADPPEHVGGYKLYKRLGLIIGVPIILGLSALLFLKKKGCEEEREPFHKYPYLRIRTKRFPWGDGQRSLFHNPRTNPLPDGYENELEEQKCES